MNEPFEATASSPIGSLAMDGGPTSPDPKHGMLDRNLSLCDNLSNSIFKIK